MSKDKTFTNPHMRTFLKQGARILDAIDGRSVALLTCLSGSNSRIFHSHKTGAGVETVLGEVAGLHSSKKTVIIVAVNIEGRNFTPAMKKTLHKTLWSAEQIVSPECLIAVFQKGRVTLFNRGDLNKN